MEGNGNILSEEGKAASRHGQDVYVDCRSGRVIFLRFFWGLRHTNVSSSELTASASLRRVAFESFAATPALAETLLTLLPER